MTLRQATHILRNMDASSDDEIAAIHVAIDAIYRLERPRWVSADTQPKATGYYVTEDARGALVVRLWDTHGWHYAWAPVVRWLDMKLEKEK